MFQVQFFVRALPLLCSLLYGIRVYLVNHVSPCVYVLYMYSSLCLYVDQCSMANNVYMECLHIMVRLQYSCMTVVYIYILYIGIVRCCQLWLHSHSSCLWLQLGLQYVKCQWPDQRSIIRKRQNAENDVDLFYTLSHICVEEQLALSCVHSVFSPQWFHLMFFLLCRILVLVLHCITICKQPPPSLHRKHYCAVWWSNFTITQYNLTLWVASAD